VALSQRILKRRLERRFFSTKLSALDLFRVLMRRIAPHLILAASLTVCALALSATHALSRQRRASLPPIRHVFVIVLENQGFDTTFNAHSRAP